MGWVTLRVIGAGRGVGGLIPGMPPEGRRDDGTAVGHPPGCEATVARPTRRKARRQPSWRDLRMNRGARGHCPPKKNHLHNLARDRSAHRQTQGKP